MVESGSRAGSPSSSTISPKVRVGSFALDGIPLLWDNEPTIRERMRESSNLCLACDDSGKGTSSFVDGTTDNVRLNAPVLLPLVKLMKMHELQLPSITNLIEAVENFFTLAKLSRSPEECYQEGWALRRLLAKLKRFTYRATPPQDRVQTDTEISTYDQDTMSN